MSRPLRIEFEGALYHVTSRGDRRGRIFESDQDRLGFLDLLGRVAVDFNWVEERNGVTISPPHTWNGDEAHAAVYDTERTAELFCLIVNRWQQCSTALPEPAVAAVVSSQAEPESAP